MGVLSSLLAFVAGCGGDAPRTYAARVYVSGLREYVLYANAQGPILTVVRGRPFGDPHGEFEAAAVGAIQRAPLVVSPRFTADPAAAPRDGYRVVLLFQPPEGASGRDLCAGAGPAAGEDRPPPLRVLAAFCLGGRTLSEVTGEARRVTGPSHPDFRALLRQVIRDLLPAQARVGPT